MLTVHLKTNSDVYRQYIFPFAEQQTKSNMSQETHDHTGLLCCSCVDSSVLFSASELLNINRGCKETLVLMLPTSSP